MSGRRRLSTAARSSPEERSGAAVVIGLGCARQGEKEVQMGPVLSTGTTGHKREGREVDAGAEHGSDDVAAGREGLGRRPTSKRRVGRVAAGGGAAAACTAAVRRCSAPAAVRSRRAEGCQRKKKEGRV
jgi:hypothetical protein